jgi:hypothetical protein
VKALKLEDDAARDSPALQDLVVLATAIRIVDGVAATDVLDRNSFPVVGR